MNKDLFSGGLLGLLGAGTSVAAWTQYGIFQNASLGAGFFPFALGLILLGLGLAIAMTAFPRNWTPTPAELSRLDPIALLCIVCALATFGLLLEHVGLVLSTLLAFHIAALVAPDFPLKDRLLASVIVAVSVWLVFEIALGLPFPSLAMR